MEKLNNILNKFDIPDFAYKFDTISNGFINDTYLVSNNENPIYILQRINTKIFTNINALIHNLDLVLPLLKDDNYASIVLAKTNSQKSFFVDANKNVWRLMTFIKDSVVYNTTSNSKIAYESGRIIGLFHQLLSNFDANKLENTLPNFHDVAFRHEQFKLVFKKANPKNIKKAEKAIVFVQNNIAELKRVNPKILPVKVCHNDTKLNNILFSNTSKALCLIDLDTIMKGTFVYDFGDAIRTIVNAAPEDEKDLSKINFNIELFKAFINGLTLHKNILNPMEIEFLPLGVVLMPFLHGIRALTDYLDGNRYYKVIYETQNLDRCLSLFTFAQLALNNQDVMTAIIKKKLF